MRTYIWKHTICLAVISILVSASAPRVSNANASEDSIVANFKSEVSETDLARLLPIRVGSKTIAKAIAETIQDNQPMLSSVSDLEQVSARLLEALTRCPSPCRVRFGNTTYLVETPALGQGERGVVYRLVGNEAGRVLKISKPELKSLAILRAESGSQNFWEGQRTTNFSVSKKLSTDATGLFSVMEEVKGEPLTNVLFRLGLLQLNPLTNDVYAQSQLEYVPKAELDKIWFAIRDMIGIIQKHPSMRTSLSPNNMLVNWTNPGRSIDKVALIDFGIDGTGDPRYFELRSLREYLALSALKIKGYLGKSGYTDPGLFEIQEEARARWGLQELYDISDYRDLLLEVATRVAPNREVKHLSTAEILKLPLHQGSIPRIAVDNVLPMKPQTVSDLANLASFINQSVNQTKTGAVELRIDQELLKIKIPALGQGDRGVVYALEGTDDVIKLPKPNLISVLTLMNEAAGYQFWFDRSRMSGSRFSVPERRVLHPLGLYSVMKRNHGEPLTKAFLRFGLLSYDPKTNKASVHLERLAKIGPTNKNKIEGAILQILEIIRSHPEMSLSISPNNLHVDYADEARTIVSDVVLIDVGLSSKASSKFDAIKDLASYLELSKDRLEKYLRVGYVDKEYPALNQPRTSGPVTCEAIFAIR